jgi:hypothetical protein
MSGWNSIIQDGRTGRPDNLEAECVSCEFKCLAVIEQPDTQSLRRGQAVLLKFMQGHAEEQGHIVIQIGSVVVPVPRDQKIVRRIS